VKAADRENARRILGLVKRSLVERLADGEDKGVVSELAAAYSLEQRLDDDDDFEEVVELTKGKL
jgi:hypothetical protein